jgi:D-alanyl-D-alanine carboxypeptidase
MGKQQGSIRGPGEKSRPQKDPDGAGRRGGSPNKASPRAMFHTLHAAEAAGLSPGITSAFRDDYRQSIASGLKAASNRSYHGGNSRGGYGHGLAADIVSVQGETRDQRWASSEKLWKWVDAHGKEFGIGRPYLGRDPPHVAPVDGQEYAAHNRGSKHAGSDVKKMKRVAKGDEPRLAKRPRAAAATRMRAS